MHKKESQVIKSDLIGKKITITKHHKKETSIIGTIRDETSMSFIVETQQGLKRFLKHAIVFQTRLLGRDLEIEGRRLVGRIDERMKQR